MKFGVITFPGSNCDHDALWTAEKVANQKTTVLSHDSHDLQNCDVIVVPGGFVYGDYLRTGAIAKFSPVTESVRKFADRNCWVCVANTTRVHALKSDRNVQRMVCS